MQKRHKSDNRIHLKTPQLHSVEIIAALHQKLDNAVWLRDMFFGENEKAWKKFLDSFYALDEALDIIYNQMESKQLMHLDAICRHGEVKVGIKPPVSVDNFTLLPSSAVAELLNLALRDTCALCISSGSEVGKCPTRKVLREIFHPDNKEAFGCEYRWIISEGKHGQYFGVK